MDYKVTQQGIDLVQHFEGCKLTAYKDAAGIWTIGYGNTQYEDGRSVKSGDRITQQRANELFAYFLQQRFGSGVANLLQRKVTENQFNALVSFAYNVGLGALQRSTLLRKVNRHPQDPTIREEFMRWNKAGGKVLNGLTRRRKAEADLYFITR